MVESLLGALMIFSLRLVDVSIGTVRTMYTVRGHRALSAILGLIESGVFITAVSTVLTSGSKDPIRMVGYAMGFSIGTLLGVQIERMIASGWVLMRVISKERHHEISTALRAQDLGVTRMKGEGRDGDVSILFVVMPRRKSKEALRAVSGIDENAFVVLEPVSRAQGGYMPGAPAGVK